MIRIMKKEEKIKKKTLTSVLESVDPVVFIGATATSAFLSVSGVSLTMVPFSDENACALSSSNRVLQKIFLNKYNEYKKQIEKDQEIIKSFDKVYRKNLQDNLVDRIKKESLGNLFIR